MEIPPKRYHTLAIILHWVSALLVLGALFAGSQILEPLDNTNPEKIAALRIHMSMGMLLGGLTLWRLWVRYSKPRPASARTGNAMLDKVGALTHWVLYGLILLMVASGVGISILAGLPDIVFNGQGALPATFDDYPPRAVHGLVAKVLLILVALHFVAALYHQFGLRDRLLGRMGLGKQPD